MKWLDWRIPAVIALVLVVVAAGVFLVRNDRHSVTHVTRITIRPTPHTTAPPMPSGARLIPPVNVTRTHTPSRPRPTPHRRPSPAPSPTCLLPIGVCVHAR